MSFMISWLRGLRREADWKLSTLGRAGVDVLPYWNHDTEEMSQKLSEEELRKTETKDLV